MPLNPMTYFAQKKERQAWERVTGRSPQRWNKDRVKALHAAAKADEAVACKQLLAGGFLREAIPATAMCGGVMAVHVAAAADAVEALQAILDSRSGDWKVSPGLPVKDAPVKSVADMEGRPASPLHAAAGAGALKTLTLLLEKGASVEGSYKWRTPLAHALFTGNLECAKSLRRNGAHVTASALAAAARGGGASGEELAWALVAAEKAGVGCDALTQLDEYEDEEKAPLHFAAFSGRPANVKKLLDAGANAAVESKRKFGQPPETPLLFAVRGAGHGRGTSVPAIEIIRMLVEAGAPLLSEVLPEAVRSKVALEVVVALVKAGADPNGGKVPPLHLAAFAESPATVKALLTELGADMNKVCSSVAYDGTALHQAVRGALLGAGTSIDCANALIDAGAALEVPNTHCGETPFFLVCDYGNCKGMPARVLEVRKKLGVALLKVGARPETKNAKGVTALSLVAGTELDGPFAEAIKAAPPPPPPAEEPGPKLPLTSRKPSDAPKPPPPPPAVPAIRGARAKSASKPPPPPPPVVAKLAAEEEAAGEKTKADEASTAGVTKSASSKPPAPPPPPPPPLPVTKSASSKPPPPPPPPAAKPAADEAVAAAVEAVDETSSAATDTEAKAAAVAGDANEAEAAQAAAAGGSADAADAGNAVPACQGGRG